MPSRALILGVGGQDGSYLAELLVQKGYEVHGLYRRSSVDNLRRLVKFRHLLCLHEGDVTDYSSVYRTIAEVDPDEVYNEADQDHVGWSRSVPEVSWDVTFKGACHVFEAVRQTNCECRMFQPISSTVFAESSEPQDEGAELLPTSPYAVAKAAAWHAAKMYRETFGLWIACGILYNHDSPRRCSSGYLLHELADSAIAVKQDRVPLLFVRDAYETVDIGFSGDFVRACHAMLQTEDPGDYVLSSMHPMTVGDYAREFLRQIGRPDADVPSHTADDGVRHGRVGYCAKALEQIQFDPKTTPEQLVTMILEEHRWGT